MAPEPDAGDPERGYARSRKKNEQARAALKPLAAGERPRAVTIGAIAAAVFAVANMVAFLATDGDASLATAIFQSGVLAVVAAGMWQARYWGVLGMQALLAITMVVGAVSLMNAANWAAPVDRPAGITGNQDPIEDLPWYDKKHAVTEGFGDASLT